MLSFQLRKLLTTSVYLGTLIILSLSTSPGCLLPDAGQNAGPLCSCAQVRVETCRTTARLRSRDSAAWTGPAAAVPRGPLQDWETVSRVLLSEKQSSKHELWWKQKLVQFGRRQFDSTCEDLKMYIFFGSKVPLLGFYPKEVIIIYEQTELLRLYWYQWENGKKS